MRSRWFDGVARLGDWKLISDLTGFKIRASQSAERWDGMIGEREKVEERHPQDFLRGVHEDQRVPFSRPEQTDRFLGRNRTGDEL